MICDLQGLGVHLLGRSQRHSKTKASAIIIRSKIDSPTRCPLLAKIVDVELGTAVPTNAVGVAVVVSEPG